MLCAVPESNILFMKENCTKCADKYDDNSQILRGSADSNENIKCEFCHDTRVMRYDMFYDKDEWLNSIKNPTWVGLWKDGLLKFTPTGKLHAKRPERGTLKVHHCVDSLQSFDGHSMLRTQVA